MQSKYFIYFKAHPRQSALDLKSARKLAQECIFSLKYGVTDYLGIVYRSSLNSLRYFDFKEGGLYALDQRHRKYQKNGN